MTSADRSQAERLAHHSRRHGGIINRVSMMTTEQKTTQITQPGTAKSVPEEIAQEYLAAGLSVLPASRRKKHPVLKTWTEFQCRLPEEQEVKKWFSTRRDALCVVCGKVSGNLEVIDFDNHGELYDAWKASVPEELLSRLVVERSQSGGFHVTYRCEDEICGNLKLAVGMRDDKRATLIETRGEGNVILCAPSDGYVLMQGDWCNLPVITMDERETLLKAAWALNEVPEDEQQLTQAQSTASDTTLAPTDFVVRPGDDYNARGDFRALLQRHNWKPLRTTADGNEYWQRPDKNGDQNSATFKDNSFYVFSTNASPFEPRKSYSPFMAYALLEHNGDCAEAASALAKEGYGTPAHDTLNIDWNGLVSKGADDEGNLVSFRETVGAMEDEHPWRKVTSDDVREAIRDTALSDLEAIYASVVNPPLPIECSLMKSIVTAACCLSGEASQEVLDKRYGGNLGCVNLVGADRARVKINTSGGQLCNVYGLIVAPSATGKDIGGLIGKFARMTNPDLYHIDRQKYKPDWNIATSSSSAEGLAKMLVNKPNGLISVSEMSIWLDKNNWQYKTADFLTEVFAQGFFDQTLSDRPRSSSGSRSTEYCAPNIMGSIQPSVFNDNVTMRDVDTGLLGRFLMTKLPEYYGNPTTFNGVAKQTALWEAVEPFLAKCDVVEMEEGYSLALQDVFKGKCSPSMTPSWRRLCNEYYPRLMVMLSVTNDIRTRRSEVVITDETRERARTLVMWLFANAERILSGIIEGEGTGRIIEKSLKRLLTIVLSAGEAGVSLRDISHRASGSGTTAKDRRDMLMEMCERGWIKETDEHRFVSLNPPLDLARQVRKC